MLIFIRNIVYEHSSNMLGCLLGRMSESAIVLGLADSIFDIMSRVNTMLQDPREREAFYILCPASRLMDVPAYRYVSCDKLMNVPKTTSHVTLDRSTFNYKTFDANHATQVKSQ